MKPLKIAIASPGRFHVLDLARELSKLGHDVRFYSYVPKRRAMRFGLPGKCHVGLLAWVLPFLVIQRYGPASWHPALNKMIHNTLDWATARNLEPCDVFVCMSGAFLDAAEKAKRLGAKVYLERGSRHIESQKEILDELCAAGSTPNTVDPHIVARELLGYGLADKIVVPSLHVERSFLERGFPPAKLFRNPYGVDIDMFAPTPAPEDKQPKLIFVGGWSLRKGADLLVQAVRDLGLPIKLLHVGPIVDFEFPNDIQFEHIDAVPQWRLREYYSQAHLFVLASKEEGLALVQAQALSCGLPIVCTDRTGGEDLRVFLQDPTWIEVVPNGDAAALAEGIKAMLPKALAMQGTRDILGEGRQNLTWAAYGKRYADELETYLAIPETGFPP